LAFGPLLPSLLLRRYVALPARTTTLQLGYLPPTQVHATLELPANARVSAPPDVRIETPFGRFVQRVRAPSGRLEIERSLEVPMQRIAPDAYARFIEFARAVDEAEQAELLINLAATR